jgi:Phage protein (N4 Gp49/phage Sf6 gene 66) family
MSLEETDKAAAAHAVAPRVTLESMESKVVQRLFFTGDEVLDTLYIGTEDRDPETEGKVRGTLALLTVCILVLENGFTLIGKSAPASPENFNSELGEKFAYEDAMRQLWPLEGYALRNELSK